MDIFQQHLLSALLRVTGKGCRAGRLNAADGRQASRRKGRDVIKGIAREQIIPFREAVVDARVEGMAELRIGRAINEIVHASCLIWRGIECEIFQRDGA